MPRMYVSPVGFFGYINELSQFEVPAESVAGWRYYITTVDDWDCIRYAIWWNNNPHLCKPYACDMCQYEIECGNSIYSIKL